MASSVTQVRVARFGSFEFDPESGELRRDGQKGHIQDQPSRILGILLARAGHLVTRDELRELLWPADTFVDFDHSLNTAIRKLRIALEDSADEPRFVETVARHGYRFVAPVEWVMGDVVAAARTGRRSMRRQGLGIAMLLILASAGLVMWPRKTTEGRLPVRTIAVLPIANAEPESEYLSDGLAEAVIRHLSASPMLRVTAPSSSLSYKGQTIDVRKAGRELGVEMVLTGEMRRVDDEYELRVELVDTKEGSQIWGNEYWQAPERLGLLRRALFSDLSNRLGVTQADTSSVVRESPAYDLYLRGRVHWNSRSRADHMQAIAYFEKAIDLDPEFALAWAGLGAAWGTLVGNGLVPGVEEETQLKSISAIDKALSLDPTLAEAWASQAARKTSWDADFEGAERDFLRAISLNPSYSSAHQWYSQLLWVTGRMDESRREIDLAWQVDPLSVPVGSFRCWNRVFARRYDEALEIDRQFFRERSLHSGACAFCGCAYWGLLLKGDYPGAIDLIREGGMYWRDDPSRAERFREAYERGGPEEFWQTWLQERPNADGYYAAVGRAMAGQVDEAFVCLERSFARRHASLIEMYVDPRLDNLRGDPRFDDLARRIGLPQVPRGKSR